MNLQELNSALPKPWLNIQSESIITKKTILQEQASVLTPPIGSLTIYNDPVDGLSSKNSSNTVVSYATTASFADALTQSGPKVQGNFP